MSTITFVHTSRLRSFARIVCQLVRDATLVEVGRETRAEVVVFRGAPGWSVLVTDAPNEDFVLRRGASRNVPRLVELAVALQRSAFTLEIAEEDPIPVLYEVSPRGDLVISGGQGQPSAHGLRIERVRRRVLRFRKKVVPESLRTATLDPLEVADTLAPALAPELLVHNAKRLCGQERRPPGSLAFARPSQATSDLDVDYDRDDG